MSRVKGEQLSQGLFTTIPLTQPQQAERPDQQAVLAVFVLGVVIEHDEVGQGDGEEVRLDRRPNPHLSFGFGTHYCIGSTMARREVRALFAELIPRIKHIELAGDPVFTPATFVSGLKRLPIRYELT